MKMIRRVDSSFRDPNGHVIELNNTIYRVVNYLYKDHYDHLISSGLSDSLIKNRLLIPFEEVQQSALSLSGFYKVLKPLKIKNISYPYEWSFSMLKDAAELTLTIMEIAFSHGMILKDASAFNIQFHEGRPVFIDTLSFEIYKPGKPWIAYQQFCQHFVAPLALMARIDPNLNKLFLSNIDGIPLRLTTKILYPRGILNFNLLLHLYLHAKSQKKYEGKTSMPLSTRKFSTRSMLMLIEGLKATINKQVWNNRETEWAKYMDDSSINQEYIGFKKKMVTEWLRDIKPASVLDVGSNNGFFSRMAAESGCEVISIDSDPECVDQNYRINKDSGEKKILPLLIDILNISPSIGWRSSERTDFIKRFRPDLIIALAVIHHLVIKANITFEMIAAFLSELSENLIIEFMPLEDEKVKRILMNKENRENSYSSLQFIDAFSQFYNIKHKAVCAFTKRELYLMKKK